MAIRECNDDLNIISALPDAPGSPDYTASQLKAKFDEAALKLKAYINGKLIPDIMDELAATVTGDGAYRYIPAKRLLKTYSTAGTYTFTTDIAPSFNGIYDIVLIGGGGGGSAPSGTSLAGSTGGGAGAVTVLTGQALSDDGEYTITVGAAGTGAQNSGTDGGNTSFYSEDYSLYAYASGGKASSQSSKIGYGGGIGATDSEYGDGTVSYGHGGDNTYGRGARGAVIADDVTPASGYGSGGWGTFPPKAGAVLIYGYAREEINEEE